MPGLSSGDIQRATAKPGRSEYAMVASVTMVSGRPWSSRPSGVAWVSTTLAVPSPSTMCITMVRASGQVNSARTGTPQVRLSRKVTSTTRVRSSEAWSSTTRWLNAYGWNQDPCHGSSRLAITSCGSHTPGWAITAVTDSGIGGRAGSVGRSVGVSPAVGSPTQISTPSSYAR